MNHSYNANINGLCSVCIRPENEHGETAQCEACVNIGPCELIGKILLCASCQAREPQSIDQTSIDPQVKARATRIAQLRTKFMKEVDSNFNFFTSNITSIVDIELQVLATGGSNYDVCVLVEERLAKQRAIMIDARIGAEVDTKYLNTIVPQLRQEEREKFKQFDISYKPNAALPVVNAVSKPKLSKDEKQYANMAKLMGISIEQAKQIAAKQAQWIRKEVGADKEPCTCTATPGFCKFHRIGI
jgi:hypothetical protein